MAVWFVTGASRGLGRALVDAVVERGDQAVAAVRDPESYAIERAHSKAVFPIRLDITDSDSIRAATEEALERFGEVDMLVNNATRVLVKPLLATRESEVRQLFDVNVFGLLALIRALLPSLRAQHRSAIVNISSAGGFAAMYGLGVYAATKFAVEAISEALAIELAGTGVKVHIAEPGIFRSEFLDPNSNALVSSNALVNAASAGRRTRTLYGSGPGFPSDDATKNAFHAGDPRKAATAITAAVTSAHPPFRLQLGEDSLEWVEQKLAFVQEELDIWRPVSMSTGFGAAPVPGTELKDR